MTDIEFDLSDMEGSSIKYLKSLGYKVTRRNTKKQKGKKVFDIPFDLSNVEKSCVDYLKSIGYDIV